MKRCRRCPACLRTCGACRECRDKPRFGGVALRKKACLRRDECHAHVAARILVDMQGLAARGEGACNSWSRE